MTLTSFFSNLQSDAKLISTIHEGQFILPQSDETYQYEYYQNTQRIITTCVLISTIHITLYNTFKKYASSLQLQNNKEVMKLSYQTTNLLVNLSLGTYGLYTLCFIAPSSLALLHPYYEDDILQRLTGYNQYTHFSAYQCAYNIWALPVGILYVDENKFMILHHMSVLTSTLLACYTKLGYNIFSVYIFGVAELSSVPLAIMNLLKDKREWTKVHFELGFGLIKLLFAAMFLMLRVILATPMIMDTLRSSGLVLWTFIWRREYGIIDVVGDGGGDGDGDGISSSINGAFIGKLILFGCDFLFKTSLGCLQYYWAYLIVNGLAKMVPKKKKTKKID
jgi:hypothetical protein